MRQTPSPCVHTPTLAAPLGPSDCGLVLVNLNGCWVRSSTLLPGAVSLCRVCFLVQLREATGGMSARRPGCSRLPEEPSPPVLRGEDRALFCDLLRPDSGKTPASGWGCDLSE